MTNEERGIFFGGEGPPEPSMNSDMAGCLHPPRGLHCAPVSGLAVHPHRDGKWWFHDETWMNEYGPFNSEAEAGEACAEYCTILVLRSYENEL
jgi:hypothetical protein